MTPESQQHLLDGMVAAQDNPALSVEDRTSRIRIRSLEATPAANKVYLKIQTNLGVTGWGEIDQLELKTAKALVHSLYELLDNENPTRIEHLWQKIFRSHRNVRGGPFLVHTLSGIDDALWDITGKLWKAPVYRLLGGPVREKLKVYPSPKASKVGAGPEEHALNPNLIARYTGLIQSARRQVGPDGAVMFDAHCAIPPAALIQIAAAIEAYDVLFIEEVAVPGNIEVFKRLKEAIRIPLATGERDRTIWEFIPYLQEGCLDVIQPDCAHTGGITQMRKIIALAEAYQVPIAPHCVASDLGVAASFHVSAIAPHYLIHEYYQRIVAAPIVRRTWQVDVEGYATLPEGPGLGIEIDEKTLEEVSKTPPKQPWTWPLRGRLSDGSIADY